MQQASLQKVSGYPHLHIQLLCVLGELHVLQNCARLGRYQLPWHHVAVVLSYRDDDLHTHHGQGLWKHTPTKAVSGGCKSWELAGMAVLSPHLTCAGHGPHLIPFLQVLHAPGVGHQVNSFTCISSEDHLPVALRINEA